MKEDYKQCDCCGFLRKLLVKGVCIFCREGYGGKTKEVEPTAEDLIINQEAINKYEESQKDL